MTDTTGATFCWLSNKGEVVSKKTSAAAKNLMLVKSDAAKNLLL